MPVLLRLLGLRLLVLRLLGLRLLGLRLLGLRLILNPTLTMVVWVYEGRLTG